MKKFYLTISLLLILSSLYFVNIGDKKLAAKVEDYAAPELCLGSAITLYHQTLNDLFNYKIGLLKTNDPNKYIDALPEINPETKERGPCTENNVTTYCVAREALVNYEVFLRIMEMHLQRTADFGNSKESPTLNDQLTNISGRQKFIKKEVQTAKNTLDLALATYHEFRFAYPMHKKLEETYSLLEKYRNNAASLRRALEWYQYKFIDVTTTKCS